MNILIDSFAGAWRTASLALAAAFLYLLWGPVPEALILDRSVSLIAEPWRLWTAHFAHSDTSHLLWDVLGLLLAGWLYEPLLKGRLWVVVAAGALIIDLAVLGFLPEVLRYSGLSGLVNLVIGAGLATAWRERRDPLLIGLPLLVAGKILLENLTNQALLTSTTWVALHEAHLIGFLAGLILAEVMDKLCTLTDRYQQHPAKTSYNILFI